MPLETLTRALSNLDIHSPQKTFDQLAWALVNRSVLQVKRKDFRILEVEFYFWNPETHPDPFVHTNDLLGQRFKWYFHTRGQSVVDAPSRRGVDLTFGDTPHYREGILIRAICDKEAQAPIEGPSLVVNHFLGLLGKTNLKEFHKKGHDPDAFGRGGIQLKAHHLLPSFGLTKKGKGLIYW